MTTLKFEVMPSTFETPTYWDEQEITEACCAVIESGQYAGVWMFSRKEYARRFCFERGLEPEFVEASDA